MCHVDDLHIYIGETDITNRVCPIDGLCIQHRYVRLMGVLVPQLRRPYCFISFNCTITLSGVELDHQGVLLSRPVVLE